MEKKPTIQAYHELQQAYDFFNEHLFNKELPDLLITLQRGRNTFGYFAPDRFSGVSKTSELAMNPDYFGGRSLADTLSTLAHEMCHVWQYHTPVKKCRGGYHDRIWGAKMEEIGLMPSNTGMVGGKKTGQQMTHYMIENGKFQSVVYDLLKSGFSISWYDEWVSRNLVPISKTDKKILDNWLNKTEKENTDLINKLTKTINKNNDIVDSVLDNEDIDLLITPPVKGASNRSKYTCPKCNLNAWAKPDISLICGECEEILKEI